MHTSKSLANPAWLCRMGKALALLFIAVAFLLWPAAVEWRGIFDPANGSAEIPQAAWKWHRHLTPQYEKWARHRLDSDLALHHSAEEISGTEWPLFGSVFYLWATESLQRAWEQDPRRAPVAPKIYARGAIEAATQLVIDPKQAHWVTLHWGPDYMKKQNVFYRMLWMSALNSYTRLTGDPQYLPRLREQVDSFATELAASPHGLLNDYPHQCYPSDVQMAVAAIRDADRILGSDHSAMITLARRGFEGDVLDGLGLVPYMADAWSGQPLSVSRGCSNSSILLKTVGIWPDLATKWYDLYTRHFWQTTWYAAGFREYPGNKAYDWSFDIDAGPIVNGYGFSANAYGIAAARLTGHFEHAHPLTAQMHAFSWPLPDGTLLLPRLLSSATDAPYLGEASMIYILSCTPAQGMTLQTPGSLPLLPFVIILLQAGLGVAILLRLWFVYRKDLTRWHSLTAPRAWLQFGIWLALLACSLYLASLGRISQALAAYLALLLLPRGIERASEGLSPTP